MTTTSSPDTPPPLRILVDCDGVLADFVGLCLDYVARNYGLTYRREAVNQWDCLAALGFPNEWPRLGAAVAPLELCRRMSPMPTPGLPGGAASFLVALEALGEVKIATTPMNPAWLVQRAEWLEEHMSIPLARQIHLHDKDELTGGARGWDVLIDDKVENCVAFAEAGGIAFCIAAPYNAHCPDGIERGDHRACLDFVRALATETE
jgi:deoxypyrimidine-specific 5' nucleotidase type C protein (NT5C)